MTEQKLVPVYSALDEQTANIVKFALENAGIEAAVRPHQTLWLDGALVPAEGSWGEVVVREEDAARATEILQEYIQAEETSVEPGPEIE